MTAEGDRRVRKVAPAPISSNYLQIKPSSGDSTLPISLMGEVVGHVKGSEKRDYPTDPLGSVVAHLNASQALTDRFVGARWRPDLEPTGRRFATPLANLRAPARIGIVAKWGSGTPPGCGRGGRPGLRQPPRGYPVPSARDVDIPHARGAVPLERPAS